MGRKSTTDHPLVVAVADKTLCCSYNLPHPQTNILLSFFKFGSPLCGKMGFPPSIPRCCPRGHDGVKRCGFYLLKYDFNWGGGGRGEKNCRRGETKDDRSIKNIKKVIKMNRSTYEWAER